MTNILEKIRFEFREKSFRSDFFSVHQVSNARPLTQNIVIEKSSTSKQLLIEIFMEVIQTLDLKKIDHEHADKSYRHAVSAYQVSIATNETQLLINKCLFTSRILSMDAVMQPVFLKTKCLFRSSRPRKE